MGSVVGGGVHFGKNRKQHDLVKYLGKCEGLLDQMMAGLGGGWGQNWREGSHRFSNRGGRNRDYYAWLYGGKGKDKGEGKGKDTGKDKGKDTNIPWYL